MTTTDDTAIIVTGTARGSDSTIDALMDLALRHVHRSRTEPGCISHAVYRDVEDPNRLFFFERWANRSALDMHFSVAGSNEFVKQLNSLTSEPASLHIDVVTTKQGER